MTRSIHRWARVRITLVAVGLAALFVAGASPILAAEPGAGPSAAREAIGLPSGTPTLDRVDIEIEWRLPDEGLGGTWEISSALFAFGPDWVPSGSLGGASLVIPDFRCQGGATPGDPSDDVVREVELVARPILDLVGTASPSLRGMEASGTVQFSYGVVENPCPEGSVLPPSGVVEADVEIVLTPHGRITRSWVNDVLRFSRDMTARMTVDGRRVEVLDASMVREMGWS